MTRIQWDNIAKAARETSEALNGADWVGATFKARHLLADLADEVTRLQKERDALAVEIACLHDDTRQGVTRAIYLMKYGHGPAPSGMIGETLAAHDKAAQSREGLIR